MVLLSILQVPMFHLVVQEYSLPPAKYDLKITVSKIQT